MVESWWPFFTALALLIVTWMITRYLGQKQQKLLEIKIAEQATELKNANKELISLQDRLQNESKQAEEKVERLTEQLKSEHRQQLEILENKNSLTLAQIQRDHIEHLEERKEEWEKRLLEQKSEVAGLKEQFHKEFKNIAQTVLHQQGRNVQHNNEDNLKKILQPFREQLEGFQKRVNETHEAGTKDQARLVEQIKSLSETHKTLSTQAEDLTKALKGDNKLQGNWGEVVLIHHLEAAGFVRDENFQAQIGFSDSNGKKRILDALLHLPNNRSVIIDAKVNLVHYHDFIRSDYRDKSLLNQHIKAVQTQLKELSLKDYQELPDLNTPDFVLMFVPIEHAWQVIVQSKYDIMHEGYKKNVIIVGPSTLLPTLRLIYMMWKTEKQNRNAIEIADRGGKLYDKFCSVQETILKMETHLRNLTGAYEDVNRQLHGGTGNLLRQVELLKELGATTKKSLTLPPD